MECQSYDGYRDPRIILSNERKKFPNEAMVEATRPDQGLGHISPPKVGNIDATSGVNFGETINACNGDARDIYDGFVEKEITGFPVTNERDQVDNHAPLDYEARNGVVSPKQKAWFSFKSLKHSNEGPNVSIPCVHKEYNIDEAALLNSPGVLEEKKPTLGRRSWRRDTQTSRHLVEAAADKLSLELDHIDTLPLYWVRRGERIPSPPSPPPPTSEARKSPQKTSWETEQEEQVPSLMACLLNSTVNDKFFRYELGHTSPCEHPNELFQYDRKCRPLLRQDIKRNDEPKVSSTVVEASNKIQTESIGNKFSLSPPKLGCPYSTATSPKKLTMYAKGLNNGDDLFIRHMESPQLLTAAMEVTSPGSLNISGPCHLHQTESTKSKEDNKLDVGCVSQILERISNMERLLEQEVSAEKGLLAQCLVEIQKLLSFCVEDNVRTDDFSGKEKQHTDCVRREGGNLIQNGNKMLGLSNTGMLSGYKAPVFNDGEQYKPINDETKREFRTENEVNQQPNDSSYKLRGYHQQEQTSARKRGVKKTCDKPSKRSAGSRVKTNRTCLEEFPARTENQAAATSQETKQTPGSKADHQDHDYDSKCGTLLKDVTTTSCSSTNALEKTSSCCEVKQPETSLPQGRSDPPGHRLRKNLDKTCSTEEGEVKEETTKSSVSEDDRPLRKKSPKKPVPPKHRSRSQSSPTMEEQLKKSFDQAQRAMLQVMIEKLNAHLRKVSALASFESSASSIVQRGDLRKQDGELVINLGQPPASTGLKHVPNLHDGTTNFEDIRPLSQKNIITQTYEPIRSGNALKQEKLINNFSTQKSSLQQEGVGQSNFTPEETNTTASPDQNRIGHTLLYKDQSASKQGMQPTFVPQNTQHRQCSPQKFLRQGCNLLDVSNDSLSSPYQEPLAPLQFRTRTAPTNEQNVSRCPNELPQHQGQFDSKYVDFEDHNMLESHLGCPPFFFQTCSNTERGVTEEDHLRSQPQTPHYSNVLYSPSCEVKGHVMAEDLTRGTSDQHGFLYVNFVPDGNGGGDIIPPPGYTQLSQTYPNQLAPEYLEQGENPARSIVGHFVGSAKPEDQYLQFAQWSQQERHDYSQQQQQREILSNQNQFDQSLCTEIPIGSRNQPWTHNQESHDLQYCCRQDQIKFQINKINIPHQASIPGMCQSKKTYSSSKVNLPNSCPTVAFAPVSCNPTWPDMQIPTNAPPACVPPLMADWSARQGSSTCPLLPSPGSNPRQGSRKGSQMRYLSKQPDPCAQPPTDHLISTHHDQAPPKDAKRNCVEREVATEKLTGTRRALSQGSSVRSNAANRTVCLTNLPTHLAEMDLFKVLNEHGFVTKIYFIKHRTSGQFQGTAYVKFREFQEAESAVKALHNLELKGQKVTAALMSKRSSKTSS
ncbi:zinc finger CCHC-type and RNA-binding motif-containing protein 1 [Elysia marginata]|uniref:Zinc finger CCHC-type and RNA-binding motif-containing protein 1 n=1 Tax=Elysia marginata TaxID=1093978 RepID=A0AAV4FBA4_9GAST|nr:zinc finger CCHC-type and RNA-binding motif-containing protein 1 [Elysia marginata]